MRFVSLGSKQITKLHFCHTILQRIECRYTIEIIHVVACPPDSSNLVSLSPLGLDIGCKVNYILERKCSNRERRATKRFFDTQLTLCRELFLFFLMKSSAFRYHIGLTKFLKKQVSVNRNLFTIRDWFFFCLAKVKTVSLFVVPSTVDCVVYVRVPMIA